MTAELRVTPIAWTHFAAESAAEVMAGFSTDADGGQALAEVGGRACYGSFDKPNPKDLELTRTESTSYAGTHSIECFIIKRGALVARTDPFFVNIQ